MQIPIIILSLLYGAVPLVAQEPVIKTKILALGLSGPVHGLYFRNDGKAQHLEAAMTGLGQPIVYSGPALIPVFATPEEALATAKNGEAPKPVASVRLPAGHDHVLLVILSAKDASEPPVIKAYGASTRDHKGGDYRFFNFSEHSVAVKLGDKVAGLKPHGTVTIARNQSSGEVDDIEIKLGLSEDGVQPKLVFSTVWGHRPQRRNFVMIMPGTSDAKPLDVRRYYDVPQQ